jgi:hypothetical protein
VPAEERERRAVCENPAICGAARMLAPVEVQGADRIGANCVAEPAVTLELASRRVCRAAECVLQRAVDRAAEAARRAEPAESSMVR